MQVREQGGVPVLASLLNATDAGTAAAAVGAVQNVSREPASCQLLLDVPRTVETLAELLASDDVQVQA